ncbi:hypothetical protein [Sphingomonas sp.]
MKPDISDRLSETCGSEDTVPVTKMNQLRTDWGNRGFAPFFGRDASD